MRPLTPAEARARVGASVWLDVRSEAEFAVGHIAGSGNVPFDTWAERHQELPPPDAPVIVIGENAVVAEAAARRLSQDGRRNVSYVAGDGSSVVPTPDRGPPARLWRPTPFLEQALVGLPRGLAIDVACGTGRDAVYLALSGFEVEAWDIDAEGLRRAEALAARQGVSIRTHRADLEAPDVGLPEGRYALVTCFRFLHRPLLPVLARALAPGGHVIVETFRAGQERFGRPRRARFLLEPGELRAAFADLEVLQYGELEPPGGPIVARLLARRPGPSPAPAATPGGVR